MVRKSGRRGAVIRSDPARLGRIDSPPEGPVHWMTIRSAATQTMHCKADADDPTRLECGRPEESTGPLDLPAEFRRPGMKVGYTNVV
jgi:hypothetical protein